jgi:TetR/AcrR family transcriptional regulator, mexJK operon transcriptional repressor
MGGQAQVTAARKRGRPTADERRAREAEILSAALGVFLHSGYGGSTVDELAAAARVTKRTLYSYFGDKAALFAAMVRHLAAAVSLDAAADDDTLETLAARIVSRVYSDELVGLHRLVIAESARFPELAMILHNHGDARHIARLAEHIRAERGAAREQLAEPLFSLLLGEKHRRRLLGIDPPPTPGQAAAHADAALALLSLQLTEHPDLPAAVPGPTGIATSRSGYFTGLHVFGASGQYPGQTHEVKCLLLPPREARGTEGVVRYVPVCTRF